MDKTDAKPSYHEFVSQFPTSVMCKECGEVNDAPCHAPPSESADGVGGDSVDVEQTPLPTVRDEAHSNEHYCHAEGCDVVVPPKMHMCLKHWRMVPTLVQQLIWKHYREGQEIDKRPTLEYITIAFTSVSCVALKEGRPLPTYED